MTLWRIAVGVIFLFTAGPGLACAQIKHNDFTGLNSPFSTTQASPVVINPDQMGITGNSLFVGKLPSLNGHMNDSRATLTGNSFNKTTSPLSGEMASTSQWKSNFPLGPNLPLKMAPSSPTRQPQLLASMQKNSVLDDFTNRDRLDQHQVGPSKFTDGYTFHAVDNGTQLAEVGHELSLQDVNRYQFQGSFSGTPGLPVTHAGGTVDQANVSGGSLGKITSGDSLFDTNSMPVSHPRSGSAIAPNFITTGGTIPYDTRRGISTNGGPLGGSSGSGSTKFDEVLSDYKSVGVAGNTAPEIPSGRSLLPSGNYTTPKADDGTSAPLQVTAPEVIIKGDVDVQK
jgi:hypothetical protein